MIFIKRWIEDDPDRAVILAMLLFALVCVVGLVWLAIATGAWEAVGFFVVSAFVGAMLGGRR